jgi:hypothetical protein
MWCRSTAWKRPKCVVQLAKIYCFTHLDGNQPDAWRYVNEVQDAGKPVNVAGDR